MIHARLEAGRVRMLYVGRHTTEQISRVRHEASAARTKPAGGSVGEVASVANGIPVWEATRRDQTARVSWHASDTRREFAFSYVEATHKQGHTRDQFPGVDGWTRARQCPVDLVSVRGDGARSPRRSSIPNLLCSLPTDTCELAFVCILSRWRACLGIPILPLTRSER